MVELAYGNFLIEDPGLASITRDADAAVVAVDDEFPVGGMYPECMMVRVNAAVGDHHLKGLTAVLTPGHGLVDHPEPVLILRIRSDVLEIEGPVGDDGGIAVHQCPVVASVI